MPTNISPWVLLAAIILVLAFILRSRFFTVVVKSDSMLHSFAPNTLLLARRIPRGGRIERGDVLAFFSREFDTMMIKRVIGLPGDRISLRSDGSVVVNGIVIDEPYVASRGGFRGDFHVPAGQVFFLGDNREWSEDSRSWESPYIPLKDLKGTIVFRFSDRHRRSQKAGTKAGNPLT